MTSSTSSAYYKTSHHSKTIFYGELDKKNSTSSHPRRWGPRSAQRCGCCPCCCRRLSVRTLHTRWQQCTSLSRTTYPSSSAGADTLLFLAQTLQCTQRESASQKNCAKFYRQLAHTPLRRWLFCCSSSSWANGVGFLRESTLSLVCVAWGKESCCLGGVSEGGAPPKALQPVLPTGHF